MVKRTSNKPPEDERGIGPAQEASDKLEPTEAPAISALHDEIIELRDKAAIAKTPVDIGTPEPTVDQAVSSLSELDDAISEGINKLPLEIIKSPTVAFSPTTALEPAPAVDAKAPSVSTPVEMRPIVPVPSIAALPKETIPSRVAAPQSDTTSVDELGSSLNGKVLLSQQPLLSAGKKWDSSMVMASAEAPPLDIPKTQVDNPPKIASNFTATKSSQWSGNVQIADTAAPTQPITMIAQKQPTSSFKVDDPPTTPRLQPEAQIAQVPQDARAKSWLKQSEPEIVTPAPNTAIASTPTLAGRELIASNPPATAGNKDIVIPPGNTRTTTTQDSEAKTIANQPTIAQPGGPTMGGSSRALEAQPDRIAMTGQDKFTDKAHIDKSSLEKFGQEKLASNPELKRMEPVAGTSSSPGQTSIQGERLASNVNQTQFNPTQQPELYKDKDKDKDLQIAAGFNYAKYGGATPVEESKKPEIRPQFFNAPSSSVAREAIPDKAQAFDASVSGKVLGADKATTKGESASVTGKSDTPITGKEIASVQATGDRSTGTDKAGSGLPGERGVPADRTGLPGDRGVVPDRIGLPGERGIIPDRQGLLGDRGVAPDRVGLPGERGVSDKGPPGERGPLGEPSKVGDKGQPIAKAPETGTRPEPQIDIASPDKIGKKPDAKDQRESKDEKETHTITGKGQGTAQDATGKLPGTTKGLNDFMDFLDQHTDVKGVKPPLTGTNIISPDDILVSGTAAIAQGTGTPGHTDSDDKDKSENDKRQRRRKKYIIAQGDTIDSIARKELGDERYAGLIMTINQANLQLRQENGKTVADLLPGTELWLPSEYELHVHAELYFIE